MNSKDPKITALEFNECITRHDLKELTSLMSDNHLFVDREGTEERTREKAAQGWEEFFRMFPDYRNTMVRVESKGDAVVLIGYAYWNENNRHDPALWVAKIAEDRVAEWRIYYDTIENWKKLGIS